MTDPTSLPARLHDFIDTYRGVDGLGYTGLMFQAAESLELQAAQLAALTARLDRAVKAAEEHFGDDAVRYKLSLSQNGRARNVFPSHMDGKWFAFQRADNDAHVGLALRCAELQEEVARLRGIKPDCPPRPDHHNDANYQHPALPRYGLRWNGPGEPVSVPMADGYWTPFHLALDAVDAVEQPEPSLDDVLRLADTHAEESYENGDRRLDRGGLHQFAKDLLSQFGA